MRTVVILCLLAYKAREAPPPPPSSPPTPSAPAAGVTWSGEPIEPRVVPARVASFALGDVSRAVHTSHGWVATKFRSTGGTGYVDDVVDDKGVIATLPSAQLVADGDTVYVVTETTDAPPVVQRLADRKLVPVAGKTGLGWAFGGIGIANDTRAGLRTQHWQTLALDRDRLTVVEAAKDRYATGAAKLGDEILVATREHDPQAGTNEKAAALIAGQQGDPSALGAIIGQPRGWLLHVDAKGHVGSKELFADQTPGQVAATTSGWLVLATEGTAGRMFKDGLLLARAPGDPTLHILARDLELASSLIAAGDWVCLYTMPGDNRVVHCVDPVRRIHITSQALPDNISLYGIVGSKLILHHSWYPGGYRKPAAEDAMELALP